MRFSRTVVKWRIPILVITLLLMIPAVLGMIRTRVNYDMLDYLPADMDTVTGQEELLKEFGKGAFSILIFENMTVFPVPVARTSSVLRLSEFHSLNTACLASSWYGLRVIRSMRPSYSLKRLPYRYTS